MTINDLCVLLDVNEDRIIAHNDFNESINKLINDKIIEKMRNGDYVITDRGRAWLSMILKTPYPHQIWVDDEGHPV